MFKWFPSSQIICMYQNGQEVYLVALIGYSIPTFIRLKILSSGKYKVLVNQEFSKFDGKIFFAKGNTLLLIRGLQYALVRESLDTGEWKSL